MRKSYFKSPLAIASLGCLMALAVACGDDDDTSNPTPSGGSKATGGTNSTAGKSNSGGSNSTAGKSGGGSGETNTPVGGGGAGPGPGPGDGGAGGEGGAPVNCTDDDDNGCYSCKPKTLTQFLNACPTTGCEPFDNGALSSLDADGKLPDLP